MADLRRAPAPPLRALVDTLWAHEPADDAAVRPGMREHVLPTGGTHIALRLSGLPLLIFDGRSGMDGHCLGHAVVGGARTAFHVRDISAPAASVGAMLRPGAARVLLGAPEAALAHGHTPLDLLLGRAEVDALLGQLHAAGGGAARLTAFERWLARRAQGRPPGLHPALAGALPRLNRGDARVDDLVRASGLSHRHFIACFREATGLAPRELLRLRRFGHALELATCGARGWAEIAAAAGFADQSHLTHAFREIAGFTPSAWRRRADPAAPRHVPH